jgi:hypothetical protein
LYISILNLEIKSLLPQPNTSKFNVNPFNTLSIVFFVFVSFSQAKRFTYNKPKDDKFVIDLNKEGILLNNSQPSLVIIKGAIFDSSILSEDPKNENWLIPFNAADFQLSFNVLTDLDNTGIRVKIVGDNTSYAENSMRSTLYIILSDTVLADFLKQNQEELSIIFVDTISKENLFVFKLTEISGLSDFKWKTNQLLYNLEKYEKPEVVSEEKNKNYFVQLGLNKSFILPNNKLFSDYSNYQIELNLLKHIKSYDNIKFFLGIGGAMANYSFNTIENSLTGLKVGAGIPLDSIYCSVNGIVENYNIQNIQVNLPFVFSRVFENKKKSIQNKKKSIQFELIPYLSLVNKFNSTITSGTITTFGTNSQINEFIYNIPTLGLRTISEELINKSISHKTLNYGFNARFTYSHSFGEFSLNPFIGLQGNVFKNKDRKNSSFSTVEGRYYGSYSTRRNVTILSPTIGLSIVF